MWFEIFGTGFEIFGTGFEIFEQGSKIPSFDLDVFGSEVVMRPATEHVMPGTSKQDTLKINIP